MDRSGVDHPPGVGGWLPLEAVRLLLELSRGVPGDAPLADRYPPETVARLLESGHVAVTDDSVGPVLMLTGAGAGLIPSLTYAESRPRQDGDTRGDPGPEPAS